MKALFCITSLYMTALILMSMSAIALTKCDNTSSHIQSGKVKRFKHDIQLVVTDSTGSPLSDTAFWITLDVVKRGSKVTIQFPWINFQTLESGQTSGGFVNTVDGFLPQCVLPHTSVTTLAASNNGASQSFSLLDAPPANPLEGYILTITNEGSVAIQAIGTPGNIIAPGNQIMLPIAITYTIKKCKK